MSRLALLLLGVAGALLGLTAEWAAFGWDDPRHWLPDLAVGWFFIACGLVGRRRRPDSRTGSLMVAVGFTWFLGNFASVDIPAIAWLSTHALYLHRGPLIHCVLSFPSGRLSSRLDRAAVAVGYVAATITPIARNEVATVILGALVMAVAVRGYVAAIGPARRTRRLVVRAAVAVGIALSGGALARLSFPSGAANEAALLAYEVVLCAVAVGLLIGLLRASSERAAVTDLVVELAESPSGTLRDALAVALGDPTLQVGYWLPESGRYVDAGGRRLEFPQPGTGRAVTPIELDGRPIGILVHDPAVLDDPGLLESIASAARLAASNARLQAEVRAQVAEVMASRLRLVKVGDQERRRLERRLREGAEQRLDMLAGSLVKARALAEESADGQTRERLEQAERQLRRTMQELHELAQGLHPRTLEESGLAGALAELARQSPVPIAVHLSAGELPRDVEAGAYYVCSEALANLAKHARASSGVITVATRDGRLQVEVVDDGVGGADARKGTGLRGLADRVEALGGRVTVASSEGEGTRLTAEIPLGGEALTDRSADLREGLLAEQRLDEEIGPMP
jgi:signal transduction histidine kinase